MANDPSGWSRWGPPPTTEPGAGQPGHLRPLSIGDLLQVTARVLRRSWRTVLPIALVFQLPVALLVAASQAKLGEFILDRMVVDQAAGVSIRPLTTADVQAVLPIFGLVIGASVIYGLVSAVAGGAYALVVAGDYRGQQTGFLGVASAALRRGLSLIGVDVLTVIISFALISFGLVGATALLLVMTPGGIQQGGLGVFLALVVAVAAAFGVILLAVRLSVAIPAAALEPIGPLHALRRSWHLTGSNAWRTFGLILIVGLVVAVLAGLAGQLTAALFLDRGSTTGLLASPDLLAETITDGVITAIFAPVAPVAMAALYHDLRVRRDGLDLSVDAVAAPET